MRLTFHGLALGSMFWSVGPATTRAHAATRLFITNHVQSNQVTGLEEWRGELAAATQGGIVFVNPATGSLRKVMVTPNGLPSNRILCLAATPSGSLWAGTADRGIARLKPDGSFRRTLTSFDGLPTDRVQAIYVHQDSVWIGTSGGVALFTEDAANGQVVLRRSDTSASTAGALVGGNVLGFRQLADTLWCATGSGLSTFAAGAWQSRAAALNVAVQALETHEDTLWAATVAGPRRYAAGGFTLVAGGYAGACVSLASLGGTLYSGSNGAGVFRYTVSGWSTLGSAGLPSLRVNALRLAADGRLWAGTEGGLARNESPPGTAASWTPFLSPGPAVNVTQRAVADARGVWFATGNAVPPGGSLGTVLHYDGGGWGVLTPASTGGSLQAASVFAILSDRSGKLWFGHCCSAGDPKPRTERWDPATDHWDTLGVTNLYTLKQSPSGVVYGGSVELGNGVYLLDEATAAVLDSLTPLNTQGSATGAGLSSNNLRGIDFESSGRGWFAHAAQGFDTWDGRGTLDHQDDIWDHVATSPSLMATAVVTTGASAGWVGTTAGLVRIQGGFIDPAVTATTNAALPSLLVQDLALDPNGNLWVATALGLARVEAGSGTVERWTRAEGLPGDDVRCVAWDARRGVLWAGTADGISEIIPIAEGSAGFDDRSYVYPNPLDASASSLRIGGISNSVTGEVRDLTGALIRHFHCDPVQDQVWDLRLADGSRAAPGVYLVVLRDGGRSRAIRIAVIR